MGFTFPSNPYVSPNIITALVMLLWIPVVFLLFNNYPARRAVVISFIAAWLFLPQAMMALPGLPDYTKMSATCYGILLATVVFDVNRIMKFQFGWLDIPMTLWCICPFFSSMTNGLGAYDGVSAVLDQSVTWGVPYFLGRIYLNDLQGLRQLAIGIFVGGLIYVPLCLFEIRMSPQLHAMIYGGHAFADFGQSMRYGGFRPTVFMIHGLAVGAWMMAATLLGLWMWQAKTIKKIRNFDVKWLIPILSVTFVLCKSTGAYGLLLFGLIIFGVGRFGKTAFPAYVVIILVFAYLYTSSETEKYVTDQIVEYASRIFDADRMQSLEFRFNNEELLVDKARDRIVFGWGGWGRALLFDERGIQTVVQDSLWIIAFGQNGVVGLFSLFSSMLLPVVALFWTRCPAKLWMRPEIAPAAALGVSLILYMVDCLLNAMVNPIYVLACGGIAGTVMNPVPLRRSSPKPSPVVAASASPLPVARLASRSHSRSVSRPISRRQPMRLNR